MRNRDGRAVHLIKELYSEEAMPGVPLLEAIDNKRVLIENHNGIVSYGSTVISIKVRYGKICVTGKGLELCRMTKESVVITGCIDHIEFCRRG